MKKKLNLFRVITLVTCSFGLLFSISCEQQEDPVLPTACFSLDGNQFEANETIVFDNCSQEANLYAWDFGDGATSSDIEPTHSYTEAGEYIVTLRALNREQYDEDTKIIYITSTAIDVEACFTASSTSIETSQSVSFSNCSTGADTYSWSFGDGTTSTSTNPSHVYNTAGLFTVILTASNIDNSDTYQMQINATEPPVNVEACFTYSPASIEEGQSVSFTNCSKGADSYYWEFGDGTNSTATSPSHVFNEAGNYNVSLVATGGGNSDTQTKQLTVNPVASSTARVDFYVEMSIEYLWGRFDFDYDYVDVAGSFNNWGDGTLYRLTYTGTDGIWYVGIDDFEVGQNIEFKFRINGDWDDSELDGDSNRSYTVKEGENIVAVWYNDVSQVNVDQYAYDGVPINSLSDFFIADFDSDNHGFHIGSGEDYSTEIADGHYVCSFATEGYIKWLSTSYEGPIESSNYQIEYKVKTTDYSETNGSGVIWGMNDDWENYHSRTSPLGGFKMGYIYSSTWELWTDWISGGNASPNYNKITIRKLDGTYYVFRNEAFIYEHSADAFFGNKFGVCINGTQTVEFDYIHIKDIGLNFGITPPDKSKIKYKSDTSSALYK